jgi:ubiquinone/menaquinone biosynthesis C-methylase UbiE
VKSFDVLAKPYQWLERVCFGDTLHAARTAHLSKLGAPQRALLLGEGDGRFAQALRKSYPHCELTIVDGSAAMLALCARRLGGQRGVTWFNGDVRHFEPQGQYDVITTLFFLDCFVDHDQRALISRLARHLAPTGRWLHADFALNAEGPISTLRNRAWLWALYRGFRALTDIQATALNDPSPAFDACGLHVQHERRFRAGLVHSTLFVHATATP